MKILKKRWGSREKGGGGNEIHAPCACALRWYVTINVNKGNNKITELRNEESL